MNKEKVAAELLKVAKDLASEPKTASGKNEYRDETSKVLEVISFIQEDAKDWPALSTKESERHLTLAVRYLSDGMRELHKAWDNRDKHLPV